MIPQPSLVLSGSTRRNSVSVTTMKWFDAFSPIVTTQATRSQLSIDKKHTAYNYLQTCRNFNQINKYVKTTNYIRTHSLRSTTSPTWPELLGNVRGNSRSSIPDICWLSILMAKKTLIALRALSFSPQGSRRVKSIPVRGVSVGGRSMAASIIRYGTFTWKDWRGGGGQDGGL